MSEQPKLSQDAIALLRRVQARILAKPQQLDMAGWVSGMIFSYREPFRRLAANPECGTTACIAGWILIEAGITEIPRASSIGNAATKCLGMQGDYDDIDLFFASDWPEDLCYRTHVSSSDQAMAEIAAEAIDRWIEGDGCFLDNE